MIGLKEISKTSNLASLGVYLSLMLVILLALGLAIPKYVLDQNIEQLYTLNGNYFKYDDKEMVSSFFTSIKNNDGYLCVGTSESTTIKGGNYYQMLNDAPDGIHRFSVLSGAGRTGGIFIPMFLNHKDDLKGLKLIYMLNPAYWRADLCKPDKVYWKRYMSYGVYCNLELTKAERDRYYKPVDGYADRINIGHKIAFTIEHWVRTLRKRYFFDLKNLLDDQSFKQNLKFVSLIRNGFENYDHFGMVKTEEIDTIWNIERSFKNFAWFHSIDESIDYRYEELQSFINVCKDLEIDLTVVIAPYNERFIKQYAPTSLKGYQKVCKNVADLITKNQVGLIDATDISGIPGAHLDHQHFSSLGAYHIYKKVENYIYEKDGN